MAKSYWLVKQEPTKYPFEQLVKDKRTTWDGVRNYQARNNLQAMQKGDRVLYYHSNVGQEVVGVCEVSKAAFPDPTTDDARWVAVELSAVRALAKPVTLEAIKGDPQLRDIPLVKQSRLSVMPLDAKAFARIEKLGG
ncbi:EVE domain-containing protein [Candidatus Binatia bacterium]|jgi:predicted RNA-binding protein with PUA-like domain|nr:EVE domain-containing protein [Candidatus Binatia bacterium]